MSSVQCSYTAIEFALIHPFSHTYLPLSIPHLESFLHCIALHCVASTMAANASHSTATAASLANISVGEQVGGGTRLCVGWMMNE